MITKIELELKELKLKEQKLLEKLSKQKANKTFKCGCGKLHKIKDCIAIQTHWYESPHGCTGGDTWHTGEIQIICPITDNKNRILFDSYYKVEWTLRNDYSHNAESQFKRNYLNLFKSIINDYKEDNRKWWNNYYIDRNHDKFGINIPGIKKD